MTFKEALEAAPSLAPHLKMGLRALAATHRAMVHIDNSRRLQVSVNVDDALRDSFPNDSRWDYAIAFTGGTETLGVWLEVHPASSGGNLDEVLRKLEWLKRWLTSSAPHLDKMPAKFVWLATGAVNVTGPRRRIAAQRGLLFRAKILELDAL